MMKKCNDMMKVCTTAAIATAAVLAFASPAFADTADETGISTNQPVATEAQSDTAQSQAPTTKKEAQENVETARQEVQEASQEKDQAESALQSAQQEKEQAEEAYIQAEQTRQTAEDALTNAIEQTKANTQAACDAASQEYQDAVENNDTAQASAADAADKLAEAKQADKIAQTAYQEAKEKREAISQEDLDAAEEKLAGQNEEYDDHYQYYLCVLESKELFINRRDRIPGLEEQLKAQEGKVEEAKNLVSQKQELLKQAEEDLSNLGENASAREHAVASAKVTNAQNDLTRSEEAYDGACSTLQSIKYQIEYCEQDGESAQKILDHFDYSKSLAEKSLEWIKTNIAETEKELQDMKDTIAALPIAEEAARLTAVQMSNAQSVYDTLASAAGEALQKMNECKTAWEQAADISAQAQELDYTSLISGSALPESFSELAPLLDASVVAENQVVETSDALSQAETALTECEQIYQDAVDTLTSAMERLTTAEWLLSQFKDTSANDLTDDVMQTVTVDTIEVEPSQSEPGGSWSTGTRQMSEVTYNGEDAGVALMQIPDTGDTNTVPMSASVLAGAALAGLWAGVRRRKNRWSKNI